MQLLKKKMSYFSFPNNSLTAHLLVIFGHLEASIISLLIYDINLVVQIFAKVL